MSTRKKLISIIIPLYNEADNLNPLHGELKQITAQLHTYDFEIIFVDDGSVDDSVTTAQMLARKDKRVRLLRFSRNFGKESAITAGLHKAKGDAAIAVDADLQHPLALIPKFLEKWEQGKEVVVGVKEYGPETSLFKRKSSAVFYRILNAISHSTITPHASDYRLIDRKVIDELNKLTEHNRMIRGLIDWLGFERDYVHFVASPRLNGVASYSWSKLVGLAMNSFTAYSLLPLKLAGYMGLFILLISGPAIVFVAIERFVLGDPWGMSISGTAIVALMLVFMVGVVLGSLGLVSLYIAHIHAEVIDRPLYILRPEEDFELSETAQA